MTPQHNPNGRVPRGVPSASGTTSFADIARENLRTDEAELAELKKLDKDGNLSEVDSSGNPISREEAQRRLDGRIVELQRRVDETRLEIDNADSVDDADAL
ncbi:hypothetical protein ACFVU2_18885 [Leifsonia sp. NPDC058194]|uniref:hypothetical protein n=1 Tax=Leifsonia sp. NPDC058194 TaxID=3346374 RepID=UPI0036DAF45E